MSRKSKVDKSTDTMKGGFEKEAMWAAESRGSYYNQGDLGVNDWL